VKRVTMLGVGLTIVGSCACAAPEPDFKWPEAVAFLSKDCSLKSNGLSIFRIGNTRAYTEKNKKPGSALCRR